MEYCHRLHEIIAREQPYTFLYVGKWTAVLDKRIVIKEIDAGGQCRLQKRSRPPRRADYTFYFNKWIKAADRRMPGRVLQPPERIEMQE